jgi:mediator of RNA polymerase II transcription subunit 28
LSHTQDNKEELRTDAEQNVAKFIEVAKQLETFFLQRRLQISVLKPEQLIKEVMSLIHPNDKILNNLAIEQDCSELKQELARKDELIKKHYEKISIWLNMLGEPHPPAPVANGVPIVGDGSSAPQQQPSQNIPFQHR